MATDATTKLAQSVKVSRHDATIDSAKRPVRHDKWNTTKVKTSYHASRSCPRKSRCIF